MQQQGADLAGRVVVVMGAASAAGRAVARGLARRGAAVLVSGGEVFELEVVAREIQDAGGTALVVAADPSVFAHLAVVAEKAEQELGALNAWIQVVDAGPPVPFEKLTPVELRGIISGDLIAQAYAALAAAPVLRRRGGHLIHVSSPEAEAALPLHGAYAATKQGVRALLDSLRLNFARHGVAGRPVFVSNVTALSKDPERIARAVGALLRAPRENVVVRDPTPWSWAERLAVSVRALALSARRWRLPWAGARRPAAERPPSAAGQPARREPFTDITHPDNAQAPA